MRGKRGRCTKKDRRRRITPADAGKTHGYGQTSRRGQDHPRGCGENRFSKIYLQAIIGSPPRMRGKQSCDVPTTCSRRITPADAGKTERQIRYEGIEQDHPRGCGENRAYPCAVKIAAGSPPRMRGKHDFSVGCHRKAGITPADAGKTCTCGGLSIETQDHPRGCGENRFVSGLVSPRLGSPPRMRGKRSDSLSLLDNHRITPADAGKTPAVDVSRSFTQDHPRGCGENLSGFRKDSLLIGSPPRMRGKLLLPV